MDKLCSIFPNVRESATIALISASFLFFGGAHQTFADGGEAVIKDETAAV